MDRMHIAQVWAWWREGLEHSGKLHPWSPIQQFTRALEGIGEGGQGVIPSRLRSVQMNFFLLIRTKIKFFK